jgi:hypothetical protein
MSEEDERRTIESLLFALKHAADVLRGADVPVILAGGLAVYARGGKPSEHDVDLLLREEDADRALEAFEAAGYRTERPPEGWLVKAYVDDVLVDLIHRPVERPVTDETFTDTDHLPVGPITLPVLSGAQLLVHWLYRLNAQSCDMTAPLALTRSIREQIDIETVREQTKGSPYARAFLSLAEELDLIGPNGG